jgi:hypothetical protein
MSHLLPLDDPRWKTLESFGARPGRIPTLLRRVEKERKFSDGKAFDALWAEIFDQYSCVDASYAVLPHLVRIGAEAPPGEAAFLWTMVGSLATSCDGTEGPPPADLIEAFREGVAEAEVHCLRALAQEKCELDLCYDLSVAALGLAGHPLGKLIMDDYAPADDGESQAVCPDCASEVYVAVFDEGLVALEDEEAEPHAPDPARELVRPPRPPRMPAREPNPWRPIAGELAKLAKDFEGSDETARHLELAAAVAAAGVTAEIPAGPVFSLLGGLLQMKGFPDAAVRLFHAWDSIQCPECRAEFTFAERWWGVQTGE